MSRVAKKPISVPQGAKITLNNNELIVEGKKGTLRRSFPLLVKISHDNGVLQFSPAEEAENKQAWALAGTSRALVNNMLQGVTEGFESKLQLVGVGYKAKAEGKTLDLSLGLSHPVDYPIPEGIVIETPTQTDIVVKGIDKQLVGQVAADIRAYRPPEPYKGKGVRYLNEVIILKEVKKK